MSDKADKRKPLAESIATLFGSSTFRDEFGGSGYAQEMPKEAIVRALGWVQQERGPLVVWCIETYYAGTLRHEPALLRSYLAAAPKSPSPHDVAIRRFATALAVRSLAGQRYSTTMLAEYAFLLFCRRERLQAEMATAEAWFSQQMSDGLHEFRRRIRFPESEAA